MRPRDAGHNAPHANAAFIQCHHAADTAREVTVEEAVGEKSGPAPEALLIGGQDARSGVDEAGGYQRAQ